jgi:hypothetical protein
MCHTWEYELIKRAYTEEMQRRRQKDEAVKAEKPAAAPPKPLAPQPQPQVRVKTPIPA